VKRPATVTLYLDGALVGQGETNDLLSFNALGRHETNYFREQLDDARIYDCALSAAEIQAVMGGG
jgi:hypothetical protein